MTLQPPSTLTPARALLRARARLGTPLAYTGRDLIDLRARLGLSQAAFGVLVGRSRTAIADREQAPDQVLDLLDRWALEAIAAKLVSRPES
jgi:DNA-binding XRE family transcriptional regulator